MQQDSSIPTRPSQSNQNTPNFVGGSSHKDGMKNVLTTIGILIAAPLMALVLTSYVFQSYEVDGPSMETTLQNKDRLIVWKLAKTISRVTNSDYTPSRGDIVIFVKQGLYGDDGNEKSLVKRVVGIHGDRVAVREGQVTIYNEDHPDGYNPDKGQEFSFDIVPGDSGNVDIQVLKGEVFVMGDNRPNSLDSRSFGTVPTSDVVGNLSFRILPINKSRSFL
jgi:signal peptidase I